VSANDSVPDDSVPNDSVPNDNAKTVQAIYEAFGRGDAAYILDNVADDVDWASDTSSHAAPWYGVRRNKKEVAGFFEAVGTTMSVELFEPLTIVASGDEVLAVIRFKATRTANGRSVDMNLHHYFRFSGGKIVYYRGTEDTAQTEAVFAD
jgi:uncharacterized protein